MILIDSYNFVFIDATVTNDKANKSKDAIECQSHRQKDQMLTPCLNWNQIQHQLFLMLHKFKIISRLYKIRQPFQAFPMGQKQNKQCNQKKDISLRSHSIVRMLQRMHQWCQCRGCLTECDSSRCTCRPNCGNDEVEKQKSIAESRFQTNSIWYGMKTKADVKQSDFIEQYTGEMISAEKNSHRVKNKYKNDIRTYSYAINEKYVLDAPSLSTILASQTAWLKCGL